MIGKFFRIFQVLWVFQTNFRNTILVNILTLFKLISDSFDKSGSYYFVKLMEHPCRALFCSFIQKTYNNQGIKLWSPTATFLYFFFLSFSATYYFFHLQSAGVRFVIQIILTISILYFGNFLFFTHRRVNALKPWNKPSCNPVRPLLLSCL